MKLSIYQFEKLQKMRKEQKKAKNIAANKRKPKNKHKDYLNSKWDIKRRRIYKRDNYKCVNCGDKGKMNAHHLLYERGKEIWEVPDYYIVSLCDDCHKLEHSKELSGPAKRY